MLYLVMATVDNAPLFISNDSEKPYTNTLQEARMYEDRLHALKVVSKENSVNNWYAIPASWVSPDWIKA